MRRKIIGIFICMLLVGTIFPVTGTMIKNKTSTSSISGNTLYVGGNGPGNYSSIQEAIDDASDGNSWVQDTVLVLKDSSPYHENVVVDKSIKLYGEDNGFPVIDGSGSDDVIVRINNKNCAIKGFRIKGDKSKSNMIGIRIGSSRCFVAVNKIKDVDQGIYASSGSFNNHFTTNTISDVSMGIVAYDSDQNFIINNVISSCELYGIYLSGSNDNYLDYNNQIVHNEIFNSNIGIRIEGSNETKVWRNLIYDNSGGLEFCCKSYNNLIFVNDFYNNQNWNSRDEGISQWDDGKKGNYWDDYDGVDENGDGIGDTPYLIPGGESIDNYPLMKPWEDLPPSPPIISGPKTGIIGQEYEYTFKSTDPDGDDLRYFIQWGDGYLNITQYVPSGTELTVKHTYDFPGTKTIKAYASDEYGLQGSMAEFEVTMEKSRLFTNSFFVRLLERYPLLERLLSLVRV